MRVNGETAGEVLVPSLHTPKVDGHGSWEREVGIRSVAASMHCNYDACVHARYVHAPNKRAWAHRDVHATSCFASRCG